MSSVYVHLFGSDDVAEIDAEDADRVEQHVWRLQEFKGKPIPVTRIDGRQVRLNRFVMGCAPGDGTSVVPINGDFLDCQKSNLQRAKSIGDPTKSWDSRRKSGVVGALSAQNVSVPPPNPSCTHPILVASDPAGAYVCARCDGLVTIEREVA